MAVHRLAEEGLEFCRGDAARVGEVDLVMRAVEGDAALGHDAFVEVGDVVEANAVKDGLLRLLVGANTEGRGGEGRPPHLSR